MPFLKRGAPPPGPDGKPLPDGLDPILAGLRDPVAEARWTAARAAGHRADAVSALAEALRAEPVPRVREAIMTALMSIGNAASVAALLPYLRSDDAGLRRSAIEVLQALPDATMPFLRSLFRDEDSDVRVLATELARNLPAADATRLLCGLLADERHPNVCAAAVEVLAEVGTRAALPALAECGRRFAGTPFLPFAVSTAMARISASDG